MPTPDLRRRRRELGMTQSTAAAAIGITQPTLSRLERDASKFSALRLSVALRIIEVYAIPADILLNTRRVAA